jgi:succinate dehydrogenase/fumarate reductase flavoprotein subunit
MQVIACDVVVVGGGGAGLRAAIAAVQPMPGCRWPW